MSGQPFRVPQNCFLYDWCFADEPTKYEMLKQMEDLRGYCQSYDIIGRAGLDSITELPYFYIVKQLRYKMSHAYESPPVNIIPFYEEMGLVDEIIGNNNPNTPTLQNQFVPSTYGTGNGSSPFSMNDNIVPNTPESQKSDYFLKTLDGGADLDSDSDSSEDLESTEGKVDSLPTLEKDSDSSDSDSSDSADSDETNIEEQDTDSD